METLERSYRRGLEQAVEVVDTPGIVQFTVVLPSVDAGLDYTYRPITLMEEDSLLLDVIARRSDYIIGVGDTETGLTVTAGNRLLVYGTAKKYESPGRRGDAYLRRRS